MAAARAWQPSRRTAPAQAAGRWLDWRELPRSRMRRGEARRRRPGPSPPRRRLVAVVEISGLSSASPASTSGGQSGCIAALQLPWPLMRSPPARPRPAVAPCDHRLLPPEAHRTELHFGGRCVATCDIAAPRAWRDVAQPGRVATSAPPVKALGALGRRAGLVFHSSVSSSSSSSAVATHHSSGVG